MKKTAFRLLTVFITVFLMCTLSLQAYATGDITSSGNDDMVAPCYDNCGRCTTSFTVSGGTAYVAVTYEAYEDSFSYAKITFKLEKQFLFFFWQTVDIGEPNDEWVDYCYDVFGGFENSWDIDANSGLYRCVMTIEIHGKDGSVDIIEDVTESTAG